jgi:hypothetical protein
MQNSFGKRERFGAGRKRFNPFCIPQVIPCLSPMSIDQNIDIRHQHLLRTRKLQLVFERCQCRRPIQIQIRIYQLSSHGVQVEFWRSFWLPAGQMNAQRILYDGSQCYSSLSGQCLRILKKFGRY